MQTLISSLYIEYEASISGEQYTKISLSAKQLISKSINEVNQPLIYLSDFTDIYHTRTQTFRERKSQTISQQSGPGGSSGITASLRLRSDFVKDTKATILPTRFFLERDKPERCCNKSGQNMNLEEIIVHCLVEILQENRSCFQVDLIL